MEPKKPLTLLEAQRLMGWYWAFCLGMFCGVLGTKTGTRPAMWVDLLLLVAIMGPLGVWLRRALLKVARRQATVAQEVAA